jgi:diaminopimelate epimerase
MKETFYKYQGAGNDFVIVDNRDLHFDSGNVQLVSFLCDRRFGIGADGLMLLEKDAQTQFRMRYYNSDGREVSMCGNGGRCIAAFAVHQNIVNDPSHFVFNAMDGLHEASYDGKDTVSLKMIDVNGVEAHDKGYFMNTGVPHHVIFVEDIRLVDVYNIGKEIRYSEKYAPAGTNVNFVSIKSDDAIVVRTYERGVENETLACGTGVVASVIASSLKLGKGEQFDVDVEGGTMKVTFKKVSDQKFEDVWLIGPAQFVFKGEIEL